MSLSWCNYFIQKRHIHYRHDLLGELEVDTSLSEQLLVRYLAASVAITIADGDDGLVSARTHWAVLLRTLSRVRNVQSLNTNGTKAASDERIVTVLEVTGTSDSEAENTSSSPGLSDVDGEQEMDVLTNRSRVRLGDEASHIHASAIAHANGTRVNLLTAVDENGVQVSGHEELDKSVNSNAVADRVAEILFVLVGEISLAEIAAVIDNAVVQNLVQENVEISHTLFDAQLAHRIGRGSYPRRSQMGEALLERGNLGVEGSLLG